MPRDRNTAVFELMGKASELAGERVLRDATLPMIVAWESRLEDAVLFLAESLKKAPRKGKKPVIMHSLRVGSTLMAKGFPADVVIAGMLHDIMEKTPVTPREISRRFGHAVALMVSATTNQTRIEHPLDRYEDSLKRCASLGEGALMVRVADLMDNCDRLTALGQYDRLERLAEKLSMVIAYCRVFSLDRRVILDLSLRLRRIRRLTGKGTEHSLVVRPEALALTKVKRAKKHLKKSQKLGPKSESSSKALSSRSPLKGPRTKGHGVAQGANQKKMKKPKSR